MKTRSALRMAATVCTAAALALVSAGAQATTGFFQYTDLNGRQRVMEHPQSNVCFDRAGNGRAYNGTDKMVALYDMTGCKGTPSSYIKVNQHVSDVEFASLQFIR